MLLKFTFKKEERLKSKRIIDTLFTDGRTIAVGPVKLVWKETILPSRVPVQFGVTVSKRKFKNAVDRNHIKRRMREVIRLNKTGIIDNAGMKNRQFALMFLYTGNDIASYSLLEEKIMQILSRLIEEI